MNAVVTWLDSHKTKLTGAALVVSGALQANSTAIQALTTPKGYAWFTVGIGAFVALLGFLNGTRKS